MTGWWTGDAREAKLQDRNVACVRINTGPEEDTTRRERERVSKREENNAAINARGRGKGDVNMSVCTKPELQNGMRVHG